MTKIVHKYSENSDCHFISLFRNKNKILTNQTYKKLFKYYHYLLKTSYKFFIVIFLQRSAPAITNTGY